MISILKVGALYLVGMAVVMVLIFALVRLIRPTPVIVLPPGSTTTTPPGLSDHMASATDMMPNREYHTASR